MAHTIYIAYRSADQITTFIEDSIKFDLEMNQLKEAEKKASLIVQESRKGTKFEHKIS